MSVDFRQRSAGEFFGMLKRHKWLILLPVITMTVAIGYVVYKLPSVYESKTVLTVNAPTISSVVVRSLSEADVSQRIQTIRTRVQSRTSLEPMIAKYRLFEMERNDGVPMEMIVDKMRNNIEVEYIKTDRNKLASFELRYRDRTPEAARNVTAELASKYVSAQVTDSTQRAKETQEFIDTALEQKKTELDELAQQRLDIMNQNVETLPESSQGLIAQLEGLRKAEENLGRDIQSLSAEKGRLNDQIQSLNREIRTVEELGQKDLVENIKRNTRIEDSPAYASLVRERARLNAELDNLKLQYTDKHPKVVETRNKIAKLKEELVKMEQSRKSRITAARDSGDRKAEIRVRGLENQKIAIKGQIEQLEQRIAGKRTQVRGYDSQIAVIESKLNAIPSVKVLLESVEARYQSAKKAYDELEKTRNNASLQVNRESKAQGETISVVDPANLPNSPVAPKRELLTAFGGVLGLMMGLFLAALFEVPRLFKIQNIEDAKHYTGLPLLASVPPLLTQSEISWNKRSYWLKVLAGITIAIGAIPVIIIALQTTQIMQRVVS